MGPVGKSIAVGAGTGLVAGISLARGAALPGITIAGMNVGIVPIAVGAVGAWIGGWKGALAGVVAAMAASAAGGWLAAQATRRTA